MVANASHFIADFPGCPHRNWRRFCRGAIYLHTLLTIGAVQNKDRFKTILVIVIGLLTLSMIFKLPLLEKIAFGIGAISIVIPVAAKWIEWAWLKLALGLGWINSRILLSVVYFGFLLPIAWLSRLFTKDPLMLKGNKLPSMYITRDHLYKKEDLENIW
jgi:hypothetical protein